MNEEERTGFRLELLRMLKGYQGTAVRPELRRILEGVKSNDPYTMLKEKHRRKFVQQKTAFSLAVLGQETDGRLSAASH